MQRLHLVLWTLSLASLTFLAACGPRVDGTGAEASSTLPPAASLVSAGPVKTGAAVLAEENFRRFAGKRVGLIVNHTAMVDSVHLIDLFYNAPNVKLTALFGPEHGIRGQAAAGAKVGSGRDEKTGVPIYSLYGDTRKPTPEMLRDVDVLVFDIQDVGARFYTYISTMGLAMQAAAEKGIPFVVLDRPNPIGGVRVEGFLMQPEFESFVGEYPIPVTHGMTVGELARMIKGERMLPGLENLQLQVVQMTGWKRSMLWPETGLPWIPPSPNIPDFQTALVYPGAAFFEATSASEGRGTRTPFLNLGAPWADGQALADELNSRKLPGVRFEAATFTPHSIPGMAVNPKLEGQTVQGIRYVVTDPETFDPVAVGVHVLHAFYHQAPPGERNDFISRPEWLAKLSGSTRLYDMLTSDAAPEAIVAAWEEDVTTFRRQRERYLLYE
ncbi:MAG TPA: DUF1343 domain-containing protein [Rhodothermales bacterium]|nr:DUF1343 domain-containing protein [Rhodothermales bacterium]